MLRKFGFALAVLMLGFAPCWVHASDHADPAIGGADAVKEPNITGLFVFPDGDNLVVILNVYRSLTIDPPYNLESYEYNIFMDLHSQVTYSDEAARARYGGKVSDPSGIDADVKIKFLLNNDTTVKEQSFDGLSNPESIRVWTGVRDDPFIFPRFFEKNVISMVMSIPFSSFPQGQQDWIFWGTTNKKGGDQIDHVGRSARTQAPRFAILLNTVPPNKHVEVIEKALKGGDALGELLMSLVASAEDLFEYTLKVREKYDLVPDVLIFTTRYEAGYPNGRRLTDDIAAISCAFGDCILQELSYIEGDDYPRATVNDKEFLPDFPYLAAPWPSKEPAKQPFNWIRLLFFIVLIIVLIFALMGIICIIRWWLGRKHQKKHPHGDAQPAAG